MKNPEIPKAPYVSFGEIRNVPLKVYLNNQEVQSDSWDETWWVERDEDWYALMNSDLKNKKVRIIERDIWLKSEIVGFQKK